MCSIGGLYSSLLPTAEIARVLHIMNHAQAHRGPDDSGIYIHEPLGAGLAANRLSILDAQNGTQPMANEDRTVFVIANGEIYNHSELRAQLITKGHQFVSTCDIEVIVHLYEDLGYKCLERFNGMFALAILDTHRNQLILARDGSGMKSLYFMQKGSTIAFASEVKAFFAAELISPVADPKSIDTYLAIGYVPAPMSSFSGIEKVSPGHFLKIDDKGLHRGVHWKFLYPRDRIRITEEHCAQHLEEVLRSAVRSHIKANVPVGFYLSGGWDSSLIAALALQETGKRLQTFSIMFPEDPDHDERNFQRLMVQLLGSEHHEIPFVGSDLPYYLSQASRHMEELCSVFPVMVHYKLACFTAMNVKTVLSGEGSDELFGGYPWNQVNYPYWLRHIFPRSLFSWISLKSDRTRLRRICRVIAAPNERHADAEWFRVFTPNEKRLILKPEYLADVPPDLFPSTINEDLLATCRNRIERRLGHDFTGRLPGALLMVGDKLSMANSLEIRMPFLDKTVIRAAASLPSHLKIRNGQEKYALSLIAKRILPKEIAARRKKGLLQPALPWVREPLVSFVKELLLDHSESSPFRHQWLEKALNRWLNPRSPRIIPIVRLVFFRSWWNEFIAKRV